MAELTSYGIFTSCSSLIDFQDETNNMYHKINLTWTALSALADNIQFDKIELYRYIGPFNECIDPYTITTSLSSTKMIMSKQQKYNAANEPSGVITIQYLPFISTSSDLGDIKNEAASFLDNFTTLSTSSTELSIFHLLSEVQNNLIILNDIGYTRRAIYYILKIYQRAQTN